MSNMLMRWVVGVGIVMLPGGMVLVVLNLCCIGQIGVAVRVEF